MDGLNGGLICICIRWTKWNEERLMKACEAMDGLSTVKIDVNGQATKAPKPLNNDGQVKQFGEIMVYGKIPGMGIVERANKTMKNI